MCAGRCVGVRELNRIGSPRRGSGGGRGSPSLGAEALRIYKNVVFPKENEGFLKKKGCSRWHRFRDRFWERFWIDFGRFLGGQDGPKTAQDAVKMPQDAAKTPQDGPKTRPRRHQDGQGGHVKPRSPQVGTERENLKKPRKTEVFWLHEGRL